jgi:TetR/AcrR family transcriptional regulator
MDNQMQKPHRTVDDTKIALIRAGEELFAQHGFDGTTAEMIARRAGVNKALIHYHFRSKTGLYEEILESILLPLREPLEGLRNLQLLPNDHLKRFIDLFARLHNAHPALSSMILRELLSGDEEISQRFLPHFRFVLGHVTQLLERGIRNGVFRPVHPFSAHLSLISTLVYFFATTKARGQMADQGLPPNPPTVEDYVAHIQELFLRGLKSDPIEQRS